MSRPDNDLPSPLESEANGSAAAKKGIPGWAAVLVVLAFLGVVCAVYMRLTAEEPTITLHTGTKGVTAPHAASKKPTSPKPEPTKSETKSSS